MLVTSHWPLSLTNQTQFPSQRCYLKHTLLIYRQIFKQKNKYSLLHSNVCNMSLTSVVNKSSSISFTKMSFKTDPINILSNFHGPLMSVGFQFIIRTLAWASMSQYINIWNPLWFLDWSASTSTLHSKQLTRLSDNNFHGRVEKFRYNS